MKQIKHDFSFEGQRPIPWVDLVDWADINNQHFQNMVMLHVKLKGMRHAITC